MSHLAIFYFKCYCLCVYACSSEGYFSGFKEPNRFSFTFFCSCCRWQKPTLMGLDPRLGLQKGLKWIGGSLRETLKRKGQGKLTQRVQAVPTKVSDEVQGKLSLKTEPVWFLFFFMWQLCEFIFQVWSWTDGQKVPWRQHCNSGSHNKQTAGRGNIPRLNQ